MDFKLAQNEQFTITNLSGTITFPDLSGEVVLSSELSSKQDKLTDAQVSAIDSLVDERKTVVTYTDNTSAEFDVYGELTYDIFPDKQIVESVKIGTAVTSIGYSAFNGCEYLRSATLPNSITSIGGYAFSECNRLTSIAIPNSVTNIGDRAFGGCFEIKNITIPKSVTHIGTNAFENTEELSSCIFEGKSIQEVQEMANYWGIFTPSIITTWNDASQEWVEEQGYLDTNDIDDALSAEGKAADAEAVGDALKSKLGTNGTQVLSGSLTIVDDGTSISTTMQAGHISLNTSTSTSSTISIPFQPSTDTTFALLQDVALDFLSSETYDIGDLCVHDGKLYRCTTQIQEPTAWSLENWTETTVQDVLLPAPVEPSTDDSAQGKPADAKGTGDALAEKLDSEVENYMVSEIVDLEGNGGGLVITAKHNGTYEDYLFINGLSASPNDVVRCKDLPLNLSAAQGGADNSLVTTGDKYNWNAKADAADLRYALVVAPVATTYSVPDSWFPITFVHGGTAYSVPLAEKDKIVDNDGYLEYRPVESDIVALVYFTDGVMSDIAPNVSSLQFNSVAPVEGETVMDTTTTVTLADRTVNLITPADETSIDISLPDPQAGYSRDFYLTVTCSSTVPMLNMPSGVTLINAKGETPDLSLSADATTILRFTEVIEAGSDPVSPAVFCVTGGANGGGGSIDPSVLKSLRSKLDMQVYDYAPWIITLPDSSTVSLRWDDESSMWTDSNISYLLEYYEGEWTLSHVEDTVKEVVGTVGGDSSELQLEFVDEGYTYTCARESADLMSTDDYLATESDLNYQVVSVNVEPARLPSNVVAKNGDTTITDLSIFTQFTSEQFWYAGSESFGADIAIWNADGTNGMYLASEVHFYKDGIICQTPPDLVFQDALKDRAVNQVNVEHVSNAKIVFPDMISSKARDFYMTVTCGQSPVTLTMPQNAVFQDSHGDSVDFNSLLKLSSTTSFHFTEIREEDNSVSPPVSAMFCVTGATDASQLQLSAKLDSQSIAPAFTEDSTYNASDIVSYNGMLYSCISAITSPRPWSGSANWDEYDIVSDVESKAESTALAPAWTAGHAYFIGDHVSYNGLLYECIATVANDTPPDIGTLNWKLTDLADPDATLDITSSGALRVVAADGTELWRQGYNLKSTSSYVLSNDAVNKYEFEVNAAGAVELQLPAVVPDKVSDFVLDITNPSLVSTDATYPAEWSDASSYISADRVLKDSKIWACAASSATSGIWISSEWQTSQFSLNMTDNSFVVDTDDDFQDLLVINYGTMSRMWFTLTSFGISSKPTWQVSKQTVKEALS